MLNKTTLGVAITAALSFSVSAADNSIEKITVTANKFEQSINDVLASVNVIDRAEIDASNIRDLPSLLNTVVGLDIVSNGGFGQKADVFVRGASAKYTLVLVDGVRISDATSGSVSLTNIPVNSIERIEVIKGARAAIYGSDAIAGVINIITRNAINNTLSATFGSNSYSNYQLAGGIAKDALSFKYNAGYEETDGFDVTEKDPTAAITKDHDDDGYRNKNIGFNLNYHTEDLGQFSAQAQYSEGEGEYDSAYSSDAYDFENYIAKLGWEKNSQNYNQGVSVSLSQEENEQTGTAVNTFYSTERFEAEYRGLYTLTKTLELSGGVNLLQEDLSGSTATSLHEKRDNKALFIGAFYDDDTWLASAVIRTDDYDYHGRANTYSTGVGYKANKYISVRASHGTAFRAPSLVNAFVTNSLYYVGNSDIKPEEAVNNELGITLTTKWGRYDVTIFDNNITNLIENQYDANLGKYVPSNVARVSMQGVEISAEFSALGFEHNANLSFLDTEDETTGKELARRPSETFNYTLTKSWGAFDANLTMLYRSSRDSISYYDTEIAAFTVFNIAANYQLLDKLALHARIENLTDKEYFTAGIGFAASGELLGYNAPSRQVFAGISYQF